MATRSILFLSKGETKSSTRYRAFDYFPHFKEAGWDPSHVTVPKGIGGHLGLLRPIADADVVVVLRKTFTAPFRALLRRRARRLIFDFDDAIFLDDGGESSALRLRRFTSMLRTCDVIWAGNAYLARMCRSHNPQVLVAPTSIDPAKYDVESVKPADHLDLVWIGSSSTRKYLESIMPMLEEAASRVNNLRLKIIADFDLPSDRLTTLPLRWSAQGEAREIASSHIGIAPMPDDPWTRGKCGLKVLQYMAARLPVLVSASGVHHDIVCAAETGFLAQTPDQWIKAIEKMGADAVLRDAMGRAGRTRIIDRYSLDATFAKLLASLERLVAAS